MSIIRSPRPERYTLLDNVVFSSNLSFRALGLLSYLLSKPAHWEVSVAQLVNYVKGSQKADGRDAIYSTISELVDAGFIVRRQCRADDGKMSKVEYEVFDYPQPINPLTDKPLPAEPYTAEPLPANPTQVNTDLLENTETPEKTERDNAADAAGLPATISADVKMVFDHWVAVMGKNPKRTELDDNRKRLITKALKNYSVADLKQAIDGCAASPFHMGQNRDKKKYNGLELIIRNSEKIEGFRDNAGPHAADAHGGFKPSDYDNAGYMSDGAREALGL